MFLVGAGSMSLGVEKAGGKIEHVFENPGYAENAKSWELNRPELPVNTIELHCSSNALAPYSGLDLIAGNPPCGGLSSMTDSKISSPTNCGMRHWIRMVVKARPKSIIMENAYQLSTPRVWTILKDLTNVLEVNGYNWFTTKHYSYQLNTPQIRRRMFLYATLEEIKHPELIHLDDLPAKDKKLCPCGPYLEDLIGVEPSTEPVYSRTGNVVTHHGYGKWTDQMKSVNARIGEMRHHLNNRLYTPKRYKKLVEEAESGNSTAKRLLSVAVLNENCPNEFNGMSMFSPTQVKMDECCGAIIGIFKYIHPVDDRMCTMRELARLMGYPDYWQFHEESPHLIAQGVPVNNTSWAVERLNKIIGVTI